MSGSNVPPVDTDRRSSSPPLSSETQNFWPHNPPHFLEPRSTGPTLLHPRPLPSLPPTSPLLQHIQETGTAPPSLSSARTRQPRASLDEGDRTSSGISDPELLYASAPSSPFRVSVEYNSENENAAPLRKGVVRHEALELHTPVALGTGDFRPSGLCRSLPTTANFDDDVSAQRPTADTQHLLATSGSRNGNEVARSFATSPPPDNSSPSAENFQVQGSIYPSMPEPQTPSLLPGTDLQFEPLPPHQFPQSSTYSGILSAGSPHFHTHRPLPSSQPYSTPRYTQGFKGAGVAPSRSFGFSKHSRTSPYSRIPSGAAAPTPPGSISSMDLPMRRSQDSGVNSSRLASPAPPLDRDAEAHVVATIPELVASTEVAAKLEIKPVRAVAPNIKQIAPTPEASLQQAKHVLGKSITDAVATPYDHQKVSESNDSNVPHKVIFHPNEDKKEDSDGGGIKKLAVDENDAQTIQVWPQSPAECLGTTSSRPPEHRISPHPQPSKSSCPSEPPSPPKLSSPPNDSSKVTSNHPPPKSLDTLAEKKAEYIKIPPSSRSQYMNMLLALDDIPTVYNLTASFFTWILLAGFVLFPGTFTSVETLDLGNGFGASLVNKIVHLPLFIMAFACTGIGIIGMIYLWWKWMKNYIWLVNKIFLPGFMNALAGVISTIVNVYGVQHGEFNTTSIITISVTSGTGLVFGILTLWYGVFLLGLVKRRHVKEVGIEKAGRHGEGVYSGISEEVEK